MIYPSGLRVQKAKVEAISQILRSLENVRKLGTLEEFQEKKQKRKRENGREGGN
jgi:hypothetical protein